MIIESVVSTNALLLLIAAKTLTILLIIALFIGIYLWFKAKEKLEREMGHILGYEFHLEPHLVEVGV